MTRSIDNFDVCQCRATPSHLTFIWSGLWPITSASESQALRLPSPTRQKPAGATVHALDKHQYIIKVSMIVMQSHCRQAFLAYDQAFRSATKPSRNLKLLEYYGMSIYLAYSYSSNVTILSWLVLRSRSSLLVLPYYGPNRRLICTN